MPNSTLVLMLALLTLSRCIKRLRRTLRIYITKRGKVSKPGNLAGITSMVIKIWIAKGVKTTPVRTFAITNVIFAAVLANKIYLRFARCSVIIFLQFQVHCVASITGKRQAQKRCYDYVHDHENVPNPIVGYT